MDSPPNKSNRAKLFTHPQGGRIHSATFVALTFRNHPPSLLFYVRFHNNCGFGSARTDAAATTCSLAPPTSLRLLMNMNDAAPSRVARRAVSQAAHCGLAGAGRAGEE